MVKENSCISVQKSRHKISLHILVTSKTVGKEDHIFTFLCTATLFLFGTSIEIQFTLI